MRKVLFPIALVIATSGFAQLSKGGEPHSWGQPIDRSTIPIFALPAPAEVPQAPSPASTGGEFKYGVQQFLEVDVIAQGQWSALPGGEQLCRVVIGSEGAVMLSLQFDRWELPAGAMVYLYDVDRTTFIGGFDRDNRGPNGRMATAVLPGEEVVIEYLVPAGADPGELRVASLTHGYVDLFGFGAGRDIDPGYQSSPCQVNVNCPEASAWQDQKRAVALFLRPTGAGCTGVLLNNTSIPGKPYFHIANHCYQPTEDEWVFYFNYDSPSCVGSTGPSNQTLTGATYRAGNYYDDFVLVELVDVPPASYNVYYAGWDRSGNTPQSGTVIHHPLYDVKKITFNYDAATSQVHVDGFQLWRNTWDLGLVEAVSSGAPMFDQNRRMVGHMFDGAQDCSTASTVPTDCAKFSVSWDGTSSTTRLRDWLDPANTTVQLDGYDPNASSPSVQVRVRAHLEGPFNTSTNLMNATLRANGLIPLNEPYTALGYDHVNGGGGESTTSAVLAETGNNAIVDWVILELRNKNNSTQVLATRSALIQRDGDIVDVDGTSDVSFDVAPDQYFIAVQHRNHLGIMTAVAPSLTTSADQLDLGGAIALYGGTNATKALGGKRVMYSGDVTSNNMLSYVGPNNDRDVILVLVGGVVPTNTVSGYHQEDLNMDGVVRYTGSNNDRDSILVNIGGTVPTNVREAELP